MVKSAVMVVPGLDDVGAATTSGVFPVESYGGVTIQIIPADLSAAAPTVEADATVFGSLRRDADPARAADWVQLGTMDEATWFTLHDVPVVMMYVSVTAVAEDNIKVVWVGG